MHICFEPHDCPEGESNITTTKTRASPQKTSDMMLLDKKSLKLDNVADMAWSPTDPVLAIFQVSYLSPLFLSTSPPLHFAPFWTTPP